MAKLVKTKINLPEQKEKRSPMVSAVEYMVLFCFALFLVRLALAHECFVDETQSWLIARDLSPLRIILQMKYEGHSFMWHYILMPFAKLGMPIITQVFVSCTFALGSAFLMLKKSPFPLLLKCILVFSGGMVFMFSVNARPYCMIPFLLGLLACYDKKKKEHPYIYGCLIAALANTHMIMLPTAFLLAVYFWGEELVLHYKEKRTAKQKKALWISAAIAFSGIALMTALAAWGKLYCKITTNFNTDAQMLTTESFVGRITSTIKETVSCFHGNRHLPIYFIVLMVIFYVLCFVGVFSNWRQGIAFWAQMIFTMLIHAMTWFVTSPRAYMVTFTLMFWVWITWDQKKGNAVLRKLPVAALVLFILVSAPAMYHLVYQDITGNYSTGKVMAEYIEENCPKGSVIICVDADMQSSVAGYLKKQDYYFYMPNQKQMVTYTTWDEDWVRGIEPMEVKEAIDYCKANFENVYVLSQGNIMINGTDIMFHTIDKSITCMYIRSERYILYNFVDEEEEPQDE